MSTFFSIDESEQQSGFEKTLHRDAFDAYSSLFFDSPQQERVCCCLVRHELDPAQVYNHVQYMHMKSSTLFVYWDNSQKHLDAIMRNESLFPAILRKYLSGRQQSKQPQQQQQEQEKRDKPKAPCSSSSLPLPILAWVEQIKIMSDCYSVRKPLFLKTTPVYLGYFRVFFATSPKAGLYPQLWIDDQEGMIHYMHYACADEKVFTTELVSCVYNETLEENMQLPYILK